MEVIIGSYMVYSNLHVKLVIDENKKSFIFYDFEIMENEDFYYIFNLFNICELIFKLNK